MISGILLAGGEGTRMLPLTSFHNKHLIPIYNKFIIDYPLKNLKDIGVKNLTVVLGGPHFQQIVSYIKDGKQFGMNVNYVFQDKPLGIAHAINLCKPFIKTNNFVTLLGDNIFDGYLNINENVQSQIFLNKHKEVNRFGVASLKDNKIVNFEEKPITLNNNFDNYAVTGCYVFDQKFFEYFDQISLSKRNEYEIVDIIKLYHKNNELSFSIFEKMWSDAGTHDSLNYLNNYFYYK